MQSYYQVSYYVTNVRTLLQDFIAPLRYTDDNLVYCLNTGLHEMQRLRPDIFLDLKYQAPLTRGDIGDGIPLDYTSADQTVYVPLPSRYENTLINFMNGFAQVFDVVDAQDQRAQAFLSKFAQHLLVLSGT